MKITGLLTAVVLHTAALSAMAEDWPQWRGPERNAISKETGLLPQWPEGGPKLVWQVKDLGDGYSTPAVVGDRLYVQSNTGTADEFVQARAVSDGKQLWSTRIGAVGNPDQQPAYPAARATPTVEDGLLYVLGSDGDLACLEAASGEIRWSKNLRSEFGGKPGVWAYSESPLIDGDKLICTPGGATATILALDKKTGAVIWKFASPAEDDAGYASAVAVEAGGVRQYVQFLSKGLVGVEAETGKLLWRYEQTATGSPANIPTPVVHEGFVYSAASRTGGGLVQIKAANGAVDAEPVYFSPKLPTAIGGSVLVGDYLYGATRQALMCVDFATGDIKWTDRGIGAASILYADGMLYLQGENGEAMLVEASPEAYHVRGQFTPPGQPELGSSKAWAYPVVANGKLFLRQGEALWCFDVAAKP